MWGHISKKSNPLLLLHHDLVLLRLFHLCMQFYHTLALLLLTSLPCSQSLPAQTPAFHLLLIPIPILILETVAFPPVSSIIKYWNCPFHALPYTSKKSSLFTHSQTSFQNNLLISLNFSLIFLPNFSSTFIFHTLIFFIYLQDVQKLLNEANRILEGRLNSVPFPEKSVQSYEHPAKCKKQDGSTEGMPLQTAEENMAGSSKPNRQEQQAMEAQSKMRILAQYGSPGCPPGFLSPASQRTRKPFQIPTRKPVYIPNKELQEEI